MPPIYIMAVITLAVSAGLWGGLVYAWSGCDRHYLWLLLLGLPLSAFVNLMVKKPLVVFVGQAANVPPSQGLATPLWFIIFLLLVPPVTEEAIKLAPLLLPLARRRINSRSGALWTGLALGVSFGLGEAMFVAYGVAQSPQYAAYPWYAFTGYFGERMMVCFCHGVMTAVVIAGLQQGKARAVAGYLAAVGLHALLNLGPVLGQLGLLSATAAGLSLVPSLVVFTLIFEWLRRRAAHGRDSQEVAAEVVYFRRSPDETPQ
ncbi:MAG: YhfC family intramembrane metalloprotease [Chloroflexi bacterium]|nr:YhfC family intramembrane metalloprotease [Chloroflexota bacterium]